MTSPPRVASAETGAFVPIPSADQAAPSQRAIRLADAPPAVVKSPPTYRLGPTSNRAFTDALDDTPLTPEPSDVHAVPSQRATRFALDPPAVVKAPPA